MKVKILSDTHGKHLDEPQDKVDLLLHCGDATNYREEFRNEQEWWYFWEWWTGYPAKYKVYVPGNHDGFLDSPIGRKFIKDINKKSSLTGLFILINSTINIEGLKIFGSPYTPTFGNWSFMRSRDKIYKNWTLIEEGTDIVITHGPPKGILDLAPSYGRNAGKVELCGDNALVTVIQKIRPRYHFFGHIHDNSAGENNGLLQRNNTIYGNCSQVVDGEFNRGLQHKGMIIEIKPTKNDNNK